MKDKINILGTNVDMLTMKEALEELGKMAGTDKFDYVFTPNSEIIYAAYKDEKFRQILNSSSLNTPDGIGVVYASKILKKPISERVAGFDLMLMFMGECAKTGKKVYLFGSKEGVAAEAASELKSRFSGIDICGMRNGYFSDEDTDAIVADINNSGADVLLVCLGAPKQEKWIYDNREKLKVKVAMGVGGSLDVLAGKVERAPEKWQKAGLEWAYRLKKEPKRIVRMTALPIFALTVFFKGKRYKKSK